MNIDEATKILSKSGLSEDVVNALSIFKNEPEWMKKIRQKAYKHYIERSVPTWGVDLSHINEDDIRFYVTPESKKTRTWDEVPLEMKDTFDKLRIPEAERKFLAGVETQYDSNVVYGRVKEVWEKQGVIFTDTDTALREHPDLFKKWFGKAIPHTDNKYAALNTACWSGGSFVYVPKGVKVEVPLQAYFYIKTANLGQFERTLIIADEGAEVQYVEGCHLAGSMVTTNKGLKAIEEVQVGDFVLSHKGTFKVVSDTMKRRYKGNIYKIKFLGDSGELNVTAEHPLMVAIRKNKKGRNKEFKLEWMPASLVKKLDYLVVPKRRVIEEIDGKSSLVRKYDRFEKRFSNELVDVPLEKDFYRLIGYYLAEGHIDNEHYISFTFNVKETQYIDDVDNLSRKYFHKDTIHNKPRLNGQTIVVCNTQQARLITREFGSSLADKHIPHWVHRLEHNSLKELIKGMWFGDGSYDEKSHMFRYNTISRDLAYSFRDILLQLGIITTINRANRTARRDPIYTVMIARRDNTAFGDIVDVNTKNGVLAGSSATMDEQYLYLPIKSIEVSESEADVYNLSVEDDESYVCEGVVSHNCSAPTYSSDVLHTGVIELIALKGARIRYTTIQNWSKNVYNLVTQRGLAYEDATIEWVDCNMGSKVTMKYPSVILAGNRSHGEVLSIAVADKGQHLDTGAKMIHIGKNTSGVITTKSICKNGGRTSYRGKVNVTKGATGSKVKVVCDALILDDISQTDTYPYNEINEKLAKVEHEASVSRVSEAQLYYLMSKGISEEEAGALIVAGFVEPISKELPLEYAIEMNELIKMSMKGSVG